MKKYYVTLRKFINDLIDRDGNADGCQDYVKVYSQGPSIAIAKDDENDVFDTPLKASARAKLIKDARKAGKAQAAAASKKLIK